MYLFLYSIRTSIVYVMFITTMLQKNKHFRKYSKNVSKYRKMEMELFVRSLKGDNFTLNFFSYLAYLKKNPNF